MKAAKPELTPANRRAALEIKTGEWVRMTLAQALDKACARHGDQPLVLSDLVTLSYDDVGNASRNLAARLLTLGVKPGDNVGLFLANCPEFVIVKFALARIGAVAVPINTQLRRSELNYILKQADCTMLISMDQFKGYDCLCDLDALMPGWEDAGGGKAFPKLHTVLIHRFEGEARTGEKPLIDPAWRPSVKETGALAAVEAKADPEAICDILYTSGTTGNPKGAMVTHDMVLRTAYASNYMLAREEGRRILFSLPLYHVFGYVECLIASLFVGGAIVPRLTFDPLDMIEAAERFAVGEIVCVPVMTRQMIDVARQRGFACPSLVAYFNSGGVNSAEIWQDIRDTFGARELLTGYGMTETTASTCCCLPEGDEKYLVISNGRPKDAGVAGFSRYAGKLNLYKAVDPVSGRDMPPGEKGELLVIGYGVTKGYYNKPDENARAFTSDGWFRTGDVGTVDAEGYVRLLGRIKESYRCGGEMVMPEEVEAFLKTHPAIKDVFVVGVPDNRMGEVGCALIVPSAQMPDISEIQAFCHNKIARFKIPKYALAIAPKDVPFTATGRTRRVQLAALAQELLELA